MHQAKHRRSLWGTAVIYPCNTVYFKWYDILVQCNRSHRKIPWSYLCSVMQYTRNTSWLRDTVRQTSRRKSAAAGLTAGRPRPLTFRGMSVCLTISRNYKLFLLSSTNKYVKTTIVTLWNDKSDHLIRHYLPLHAWRVSRATGSIKWPRTEGPKHLLSTTRTVHTLQLRLNICMELLNRNMQQIALKSNKLSIHWQPAIATNPYSQGVDRCPAQVRLYSVEH